jgi:hypothetical protein
MYDIVSLTGEEAAENEGVLVNEETNRGFVDHSSAAVSGRLRIEASDDVRGVA